MCDLMKQDAARLAAYEQMYRDVLSERDALAAQMEALRSAGKTRGATYRQCIAQKLTVQTLLGRFARYGIREEDL